jgi:hypothetical protein
MSRLRPVPTALVATVLAMQSPEAAVLVVDDVTDSVAVDGKLGFREALLSLNAQSDRNSDATAHRTGSYGTADRIAFSIGTGERVIAVASPLPQVLRPAEIVGTQQPGYVSTPLIVLDGAAAGAGAIGLSLRSSGIVQGIELRDFGGAGLAVGTSLLHDGFEAGVLPLAGAGAVVADHLVVRDGGDGIAIEPDGDLLLQDSRILQNDRIGLDVRGGLDASAIEVGFNLGHGVRVESDRRVRLVDAEVHHSGGNSTPPVPPAFGEEPVSLGSIGILVLRASHVDGFSLRGTLSTVNRNAGHGIQLGDASAQTGVVRALVADAQIFLNQLGIRVLQKDDVRRTYSTIVANNIYQNRSYGMHLRSSYQLSRDGMGLEYIASNDVHRNGVSGTGCTAASGASESHPQVLFEGRVGGAAPFAPEPPTEIFGWGPDRIQYPQDYRCYWGSDAPNLPSSEKTSNAEECSLINNPAPEYQELSKGINNRCVWSPGFGQCRVGWDIAGVEGGIVCGSSRNRIFNYINNSIGNELTQRGVAAINGAVVRARRNFWGAGGASSATAVDSNSGSHIDPNSSCGVETTCTGYWPE